MKHDTAQCGLCGEVSLSDSLLSVSLSKDTKEALVTGVGGYVLAGLEIGVLSRIFLYFSGC